MSIRSILEENQFYRIPLKSLQSGHYKLEAKINGVKGDFIVDTGASTSCINLSCISHFNLLNEKSEIKAAGAGAIDMLTELSRSNTIAIGKWSKRNCDFVLFDLSHVNTALEQANEPAIHGILGADVLKNHRAVIDYGRNCLYLKA